MEENAIRLTDFHYRLTPEKITHNSSSNWLFLPGGLGFGSEYFIPLIQQLEFPGNFYRLDFPEDGSNRFIDSIDFDAIWKEGLVDAISNLDNVILVTHSVSAMLALTVSEIENHLAGFIIISSLPSDSWRAGVAGRATGKNLPNISILNEIYSRNKSDNNFKRFFLDILPYYVQSEFIEVAKQQFQSLPYHHERYEWLQKHFHSGYSAKWIPQKLKTLIIGSSDDIVTPISLFEEDIRFHRDNISIVDIPNVGHFPWVEKNNSIVKKLYNFSKNI